MDDKRCVICQQQSPSVFVTRYMGSYTSTIPSQEFTKLQVLMQSKLQPELEPQMAEQLLRSICGSLEV